MARKSPDLARQAGLMQRIYHITTESEAVSATRSGSYRPRAFEVEGFIHCSKREQVVPVANRLFVGKRDLVLLEIDRGALSAKVVEENLEGGEELFPHVYGALPLAAVVRIVPFPCGTEGRFELPAEIGQ